MLISSLNLNFIYARDVLQKHQYYKVMENYNQDQLQQGQLQEDEIPTLEQFQVGRNPSDDEDFEDDGLQSEETEDEGYTSGETEFADGQNSLLDDELGPEDDEDSNDEDYIGDEETDLDDEDADFENPAPEDDPA